MKKVFIRKCDKYDEELIGGIIFDSVKELGIGLAGKKVLLKPNMLMSFLPENAVTTHPAVIGGAALALKKLGVSDIAVGDSPAFGNIESVAKKCGIYDVVKRHDIRLVEFSGNGDFYRFGPNNEFFSRMNLFKRRKVAGLSTVTKSVKDYDVILNIPKMKAHVQMRMTLAVKNLYGLIYSKAKMWRHVLVNNDLELFSLFTLNIYNRILPEINIVDGIFSLSERGPYGGIPVDTGILAISDDALRLDMAVSRMIGADMDTIPLLKCALSYGLLDAGLSDTEIICDKEFEGKQVSFKLPDELDPISFSLTHAVRSVTKQLIFKCKSFFKG